MAFDYKTYLGNQLNILKETLEIKEEIIVESEEIYIKKSNEELVPNAIYVVYKNLQASITNEGLTQPIQIIVMSEENSINSAVALMNKFAKDYNWVMITSGDTFVKQQYSTPLVMDNFEEIGVGYRSMMYISGTLFILENMLDIQSLTIDTENVNIIQSGFTYIMSGDTQQFSNSNISTTVKNTSTIALTLTVVLRKSTYIKKIFKIMNGTNTGDENFAISFTLDTSDSDYNFSTNMKLQNADITGMINDFPTIKISFIK